MEELSDKAGYTLRPRWHSKCQGWGHPNEFEIEPWAIDAIKFFNQHGLPVVIVTNQSGIADGKFSHDEFKENSRQMLEHLKRHRAFIEAIYYCPHSKEDHCPNKKPKYGMLLRACLDLGIETQHCFMIGDTGYSDMQAGYSAGCKLILVQTVTAKPHWRFLNIVKVGSTLHLTMLLPMYLRLPVGFANVCQDKLGNINKLK